MYHLINDETSVAEELYLRTSELEGYFNILKIIILRLFAGKSLNFLFLLYIIIITIAIIESVSVTVLLSN